MDIQAWVKTYTSSVHVYEVTNLDASKAKRIVDDFKSALSGKKIVLYGAGTVGRVFYELLEELDIGVEYAVDKNFASIVFPQAVTVYPPDYLKEHLDDDCQLIVTTNRSLFPEILHELEELGVPTGNVVSGHEIHMAAQSAWCMLKACEGKNIVLKNCYECTNLDNTCSSLNQYLRIRNQFEDTGKGTRAVRMIGYALGNICTLRCKNCCESVPYMPASLRKITPAEHVIRDIRHLSSACNFLTLLEFVGGEPFLHPELADILDAVLKIKNIGVIHIFTNGTVVPNDRLCEKLQNDRITIYISNYQAALPQKQLDAVAQTDQKLRAYDVNYFFGKKQNWMDFSGFEAINTDEEMEEVFSSCFLHNCNRLQDGKLYVCAHQYAGITLGKLEEHGETLSIHDYTPEQLAQELERLKGWKTIDACRYCAMPFKAESVPSGEQLEQ